MPPAALSLIGSSPAALEQPFVRQAMDVWAAQGDRPPIAPMAVGDMLTHPQWLKQTVGLWIVIQTGDTTDHLDELLALIEEKRYPGVISLPDEKRPPGSVTAEGLLVAPPTAAPDCLVALLRAVCLQTTTVRSLTSELNLALANQAGACRQVQAMDEEMRLAAQLQHELLPAKLPQLSGISFAALFRPATYVSGDVYDVRDLGHGRVGLFLGDAVGHGVPAAMMTVFLLEALRSATSLSEASPNQVLSWINLQMIRQQTGKVRTATAVYGILDAEKRTLNIARAGHPAPLILRADGQTELLEPQGSLLGVFHETSFEEQTVQFGPGDRLLIYSDGFELAFPKIDAADGRKKVFNPDFARQFQHLAKGPMIEALEQLAGNLDQQIGSLHQIDDLTALMMAVEAHSPHSAQSSPNQTARDLASAKS
ncbi:MAG: serine/threonine-protein phosphatase [Phycisphaeraceae bacterium]|nr:serine/threonine-protein phosphatase [Phycisphaeraceae bacterium]